MTTLDEVKDVHINLRVSERMYIEIKTNAYADRRTISDFLRGIIEDALDGNAP